MEINDIPRRATALCCLAAMLAGCAGVARLSPPDVKAYEVDLAPVDEQRLAAAWHGSVGGQRDALYLRFVHIGGRPWGAPLRLTDGSRHAYEPSLQMSAGEALIAWYERDDAGALRAFIAQFSADGRERWRQPLSSDDVQGRNPVVRADAQSIHVAWLEQDRSGDTAEPARGATRIRHARLDPAGHWLETPRTIGTADRDTWNLNASLDAAGGLFLVYDARGAGEARELQLLRLTAGAVHHMQLSREDGFASTYPDLAIAGDRVALTWFDERDGNEEVYLFAGALAGLVSGLDVRARRVAHTAGHSIGTYVAWNADRIGLAWCDDTVGRYQVFAQQFDAAGQPLSVAGALTNGRHEGLVPAVVGWRQGFAVGWNERRYFQPHSGNSVTLSSFAAMRFVNPARHH